jgi:hypothetical protein
MGFLDVITGRRKLAQPAADRLFAISTAYPALQESLGLSSGDGAAIVFQPLSSADFRAIVTETEQIVQATAGEGGARVETSDDSYGFRWVTLRGGEFDDLVVGINAVSSELQGGGYGDRLLCAVFPFTAEDGRRVYWIYNYKRGSFYPFVPTGREGERDNERELVLKAQIGPELPVEPELERWFALWGIPL